MRNIIKIFKLSFLASGILPAAQNATSQTISNHFFGENAWMPAQIGNTILNGKLDQHWGDIKKSSTSIVRYGGIAADKDMPTNAQYIAIIDSIRANGMEPIVQVPFDNYRYTAQQAAAIVTYINITKAKNIKYWSIGNEPDLGYSYTTSAQIAAYFKPFASAMKNADPTIKIVGPDCAWFNQSIITGLTTPNGPDDITGKDAAGRYYLDVISFHTYPFNGSQTRSQVISKLTAAGSLQDNLVYLNSRVASCNSTHNRTGTSVLKTAITEANINWQNAVTDNLQGLGANSFIGGQFIAEMMGIGMKNNLDFINIWSVVEGNGTTSNIGYIDPASGNKKPNYYHLKLLAENFTGSSVNCISNQANVKSFGSQDAQQTAVLILNEDASVNYNFTVRLNTAAIAGVNPLKININAGISAEYTGSINNQSSLLLIFNSQGAILKKYEYSLAGNAMANLPPTLTTFPVILPVELMSFTGRSDGSQNLLEWETASETNNDYFTIEKMHDDNDFVPVGIVPGSGNSIHHQYYSMYDSDPVRGTSYYRLKQTDHNGAFTYSAIIPVENMVGELSILSVYPNPTSGDINFNFHSDSEGSIHIQIMDRSGRLVRQEKQEVIAGDSTVNLNMGALAKGSYTLRVLDDRTGRISTVSIIKN